MHWAVVSKHIASSLASLQGRFTILLALVMLVDMTGLYTLWSVRDVVTDTSSVVRTALPSVYHASDISTTLSEFRLLEWRHIAAQTAEAKQQERVSMQATLVKTTLHLQELHMYAHEPEQVALLADIEQLHEQYLTKSNSILRYSEQGRKHLALRVMLNESRMLYDTLRSRVESLVALSTQHAAAHISDQERSFIMSYYVLGGFMVLSLMSVIVVGDKLIRSHRHAAKEH